MTEDELMDHIRTVVTTEDLPDSYLEIRQNGADWLRFLLMMYDDVRSRECRCP